MEEGKSAEGKTEMGERTRNSSGHPWLDLCSSVAETSWPQPTRIDTDQGEGRGL